MKNNTRIFCNNLCVLEKLYPKALPDNAQIITDSPAIHHKMSATSTNDRISPDELVVLTENIYKLCENIYLSLLEAGYEYDSYSIMYAITCQQNFLRSAVSVQKEDFNSKIVIAQSRNKKGANKYSNHLEVIFKNHPNVEIKSVDISELNIIDTYGYIYNKKEIKVVEFTKAFASNFPIYPLETVLWPFLKRFWKSMPFLNRKGVVLIEDNQMIRHICTKLSLNGYSFEFIKDSFKTYYDKNYSQYNSYAEDRFRNIEAIISKNIRDFVDKNVENAIKDTVYNYLLGQVKTSNFQYATSYKCAQNFINKTMANKKSVLSNMLKNPLEYGFATACRDKGITIYTFQHGICREISPHFDYIPQITESNMPHYFITNTKKAAEVSLGYPFTKAKTIAVGITKDHYLGGKYCKNSKFPEIFYISTNVYSGSSGFLKAGGDDVLSYKTEKFIIRDVLAKINSDVLYKTYPTQKYLDIDPCIDEISKYKNIVLYKEDKDLRYLSKYARILVTGKATSTFNWCFLTGKPVIFLDHKNLAPLRKELIPVFKDMLFYFDLTKKGVDKEIIKLLNTPVDKIEKKYNSDLKKKAREKFIDEYYFMEDGGAEKRAFEIIKASLS